MSFNELAISIVAHNLASAEFVRVAADAGAMASQISGQRILISVENQASPAFSTISEDAAGLKAQIESSPISINFAPIDIPLVPPIDVSSVQAANITFQQTSVSAANMSESLKASATGFTEVGAKAEAVNVSLRSVSSGFMAVGHMGIAVTSLAGNFGILDKESSKWISTIMSVITLMGAWIRLKAIMTTITTGHTASIAINTTAETANAGASIMTSIAHKIKAAATWIAVAAQNALNISHATFLALTGVGIAVIIAAAVAMSYFASQMNNATSGMRDFNSAAAETPTSGRSIRRSGEDLYRKGVE